MASLACAIDTLEYLLTARLMPEDYSAEELVDALASGEDGDLGLGGLLRRSEECGEAAVTLGLQLRSRHESQRGRIDAVALASL